VHRSTYTDEQEDWDVAGAAGKPDAGQLDTLLHEGLLAKTRNPVPASFLINEGGKLLTPEKRAATLEQLRTALKV
jgi:hypothetical protein